MANLFRDINRPFIRLLRNEPKNVALILLVFFSLYFTYSMVRAGTESLFVHQSGAQKTPLVWLMSVALLAICIFVYNQFQDKMGLKRFFFLTTVSTFVSFLLMLYLNQRGHAWTSYGLFVLKEIYIVLLVHLGLAYCNHFFTLEEAKSFYGPFGAVGSIGSILGGEFSHWWIDFGKSTFSLLILSIVLVFILGPFFLMLKSSGKKGAAQGAHRPPDLEAKFTAPLESLAPIKGYVFFILLVVALSQFCVNVANLQFNLKFGEAFVGGLEEKTAFMGRLYSYLGLCTLFIQIFVMPPMLTQLKQKTVHFLIPLIYLIVAILGFWVLPPTLSVIATAFILLKGLDYSLFSGAKEMLYFSLGPTQKIGAKYLTDMVVYRLAKGLISLVLIYLQSFLLSSIFLLGFIALWFVSVSKIFNYQKHVLSERP